ncbi:MAG: sialidase family protein, partial [Nitrososphaerales archaeon]
MKNKGLSILVAGVLVLSVFVFALMMPPVQAPDGVIDLSNDPAFSGYPTIAVQDNSVFVAWVDDRDGDNDIFIKRSLTNGEFFDAEINVSNTLDNSFDPQLFVVDNFVFVVWVEDDGVNKEIMYRRSSDSGVTFTPSPLPIATPQPPINISNTPEPSIAPRIAGSSTTLFFVWRDGASLIEEIFLKSFDLSTETLGSVVNVSNTPAASSINPRVAFYGGNLYEAWADNKSGNDDIYIRTSGDVGATFTPVLASDPRNVSNNGGSSINPEIALSSDLLGQTAPAGGIIVHLVWHDDDSGNDRILYSRSLDNIATFTAPTPLSLGGVDSLAPKIELAGSFVYVAWRQGTAMPNENEISFSRSTDQGATFPAPAAVVNISNTPSFDSRHPQLFVLDSNVFVVYRDNEGGDFEIYLKRSQDFGATFGVRVPISDNTGISDFGLTAATNSFHSVYFTWHDVSPGNDEILFLPAVSPLTIEAFMTDSAGNDLNSFDSVI